jgi:hypothetical protein
MRAARGSKQRSRGPEMVRFAWLTLWAFLRISTNPWVFEHPLSTAEAEAMVSSWLAQARRRHSRAGRAALGDSARADARGPDHRPARHGRHHRRDCAGTRRHALYNGPRLPPLCRAQMDESARRSRLTAARFCLAFTLCLREFHELSRISFDER